MGKQLCGFKKMSDSCGRGLTSPRSVHYTYCFFSCYFDIHVPFAVVVSYGPYKLTVEFAAFTYLFKRPLCRFFFIFLFWFLESFGPGLDCCSEAFVSCDPFTGLEFFLLSWAKSEFVVSFGVRCFSSREDVDALSKIPLSVTSGCT